MNKIKKISLATGLLIIVAAAGYRFYKNYLIMSNPVYHDNRGIEHIKSGDYKAAINDYNRAIKLDNKNYTFYYNRGVAKMDNKMFTDAVKDFSSALKINPKMIGALNNRANIYKNQKKYHLAINDYKRIVSLKKDFSVAYYGLGFCYLKLGKRGDAKKNLLLAEKYGFKNATSLLKR